MVSETQKIVILGAGPAGWTAALYAARAGFKPIVIAGMNPGGQLMITKDVENFPGFPSGIMGPELMAAMQDQAIRFGTKVISDEVAEVSLFDRPKRLRLSNGETIFAETVIIATGARARWLGVPGEQEFMGRGVSGCAVCDGLFFAGQDVVVVGGGNVAVEEAIHLAGLANRVYLVHRRSQLRCEEILADRLKALPNVTFLWNSAIKEIRGNQTEVTSVLLHDLECKEDVILPISGVFIAIGHDPATAFLGAEVDKLPSGHVATMAGGVQTSVPGVFAAGDVMDPVWRQAITSAGYGCQAALAAERYLQGSDPIIPLS